MAEKINIPKVTDYKASSPEYVSNLDSGLSLVIDLMDGNDKKLKDLATLKRKEFADNVRKIQGTQVLELPQFTDDIIGISIGGLDIIPGSLNAMRQVEDAILSFNRQYVLDSAPIMDNLTALYRAREDFYTALLSKTTHKNLALESHTPQSLHFYSSGGTAGEDVYEMHFEPFKVRVHGPCKSWGLTRSDFQNPKVLEEFKRNATGTGNSYFIDNPSKKIEYLAVLKAGILNIATSAVDEWRQSMGIGKGKTSPPIEELLRSVRMKSGNNIL